MSPLTSPPTTTEPLMVPVLLTRASVADGSGDAAGFATSAFFVSRGQTDQIRNTTPATAAAPRTGFATQNGSILPAVSSHSMAGNTVFLGGEGGGSKGQLIVAHLPHDHAHAAVAG